MINLFLEASFSRQKVWSTKFRQIGSLSENVENLQPGRSDILEQKAYGHVGSMVKRQRNGSVTLSIQHVYHPSIWSLLSIYPSNIPSGRANLQLLEPYCYSIISPLYFLDCNPHLKCFKRRLKLLFVQGPTTCPRSFV